MKLLTSLAFLALVATAAAQPNDAFNNRNELTGSEVSATGSNTGATTEPGEPSITGNPGGTSVWWSWTAPDSTNVTISTAGSDFDTLLGVYTGTSVNQLTLVAENDDSSAAPPASAVSFDAVAGTTYAIAVDGFATPTNTSSGTIQLSIAPTEDGGGGGGGGGYTPKKATYVGLITAADDISNQPSGYLTVTTTDRGAYSSKLLLGGRRYSSSGRLDDNGAGTSTIRTRGLGTQTLEVQVDDATDTVIGTISDGVSTSGFLAERAVYNARTNAAPQAGTYTLAIPGVEDSSLAPAGTSIGTAKITTAGMLKFTGVMADGTKVTQSTVLPGSGRWPFFAPLYAGNGSVGGWLDFTPEGVDDITGPVTWTKQSAARAKNYPDGFIIDSAAIGSALQSTRNAPLLDIQDGTLELQGADLSEPFVDTVSMTSRNLITSSSGNRNIKLKASPTTGLIKGTVPGATTGSKIPVNGVVLQKQGYATGFFLSGNQSGYMLLTPPGEEEPPSEE